MKQQVRELLVTAKVAQNWKDHFNEKVEELMVLVNKVDTYKQVLESGELLDVYHKTKLKPAKLQKKKLSDCCEKPFEFLVFCN
jgi:capsular polysaccharide biosynthesis protein